MKLHTALLALMSLAAMITCASGCGTPGRSVRNAQARNTAAKNGESNISGALNNFEVELGRFPTQTEGLDLLVSNEPAINGWHGPYLDKTALIDPWEHPYRYKCPGVHNPNGFDVWSAGPDGLDGTADDICNWNR
jgi:general secretion pathway protein G